MHKVGRVMVLSASLVRYRVENARFKVAHFTDSLSNTYSVRVEIFFATQDGLLAFSGSLLGFGTNEWYFKLSHGLSYGDIYILSEIPNPNDIPLMHNGDYPPWDALWSVVSCPLSNEELCNLVSAECSSLARLRIYIHNCFALLLRHLPSRLRSCVDAKYYIQHTVNLHGIMNHIREFFYVDRNNCAVWGFLIPSRLTYEFLPEYLLADGSSYVKPVPLEQLLLFAESDLGLNFCIANKFLPVFF